MFRLYHSNDLEVLRGILVKLMAEQPPTPFEQEAILVQSQGMAHWLKLQLADGLGIAAQLDFPLPSSFVWTVFNQLKPELPQRSHFEKQAMAWKLMRLLPQLMQQPVYQPIAHYLDNDHDGLRCYQLAHKIADVFDQYLVYRPDWLLSWEGGEDSVTDTDVSRHPWQPHLWRELINDSQQLGHSLDHRARLLQQLSQLVEQQPQQLENLPKRLFVFGIAALPGSYWDVLQAIAAKTDVHFFLLNPCKNFWGDIIDDRRRLQILKKQPQAADYFDRGNPLLASWGKLGREFLTLVHDSDISDIEAWVTTDQPATLLQHIQQDILQLQDKQQAAFSAAALQHSQFKTPVAADDDSIRFVSAHSALREVQQLHDQLLSWFSRDPQLKPRDVVVMVPDIDQYAPYIDAVFSSVHDSTRIPWAIADQSMAQENPLIEAWLSLLALPDSRLLVTDVQDWLDVAAIRRRFEFSDDDVEQLKDWLLRAEIRWGLDGEHRQRLGLPDFEQNSWRKGLRQLMLGLMLPDDAGQWQQDVPVPAVEGAAAELLGKLMVLIDTLEYWQQQLTTERTAADWQQQLLDLIDAFCLPDLNDSASLQKIRDAIGRWQESLLDAGFNARLTHVVVRSWFNEQLGQQGGWQRFLAGPVNFCTLMPMRSIPFKAVCMLGMNDEDYPRRVTPVGFDLMVSGNSRRGDRSRRDDDRYLFLEAVCSAQQFLYISYRGRDARENNELQPSVLVSELQDYICDGYTLAEWQTLPHTSSRQKLHQHLLHELPLQPFNAAQFNSYQPIWAAVSNSREQTDVADFVPRALSIPAELERQEILWDDVKQALLNPARFFVRRRLRCGLDLFWQAQQTEEPFVPDSLELFQLREHWLEDFQVQHEARFLSRQQALGKLPVNNLGRVWAEQIEQQLLPLGHTLQAECDQPLEARTLQLTLAEGRVIGELQQAFEQAAGHQQLIFHRVGGVRGQHVLSAWLDLVMASAAGASEVRQAVIYGLDKKSGAVIQYRLRAPAVHEAQALVQRAVDDYWQCWQQPLDFIIDVLWEHQQLMASGKYDQADEQQQARDKLLQQHLNNEYSPLADIYLQRCLPHLISQLQQPEFFQRWLEQYDVYVSSMAQHLLDDTSAGQAPGGVVV